MSTQSFRVSRGVVAVAASLVAASLSACALVPQSKEESDSVTFRATSDLVKESGWTDKSLPLKVATPLSRVLSSNSLQVAAKSPIWVNGLLAEQEQLLLKDGSKAIPSTWQRPAPQLNQKLIEIVPGDNIWVDSNGLRPLDAPRAVVGSFPEPFAHGQGGKRWPLRIECMEPAGELCRGVRDKMIKSGTPAVTSLIRSSNNPETARITVGTWKDVRLDPAAVLAEAGPLVSGVYAKPQKDGKAIALLNRAGKTVRTIGAGDGVIYAGRYRDEAPSWTITAVDQRGVSQAVQALDEVALRGHLAIAVVSGKVVALPTEDGN